MGAYRPRLKISAGLIFRRDARGMLRFVAWPLNHDNAGRLSHNQSSRAVTRFTVSRTSTGYRVTV